MTELKASMLLAPSVLDEPYDFYRRLREDAPVWAVPGTNVVVISSFPLLSEAVARTEAFSSTMQCLIYRDENGLPARLDFGAAALPTLATADPPVHTTQRRAVFPELVARRMRALESDIATLAETTVKEALQDNTFEFMGTIGNVIPIKVMARLIGFRDINPAQLLEAAFDSTTMVGGTVPLDQLNELVTRIGNIQAWIADQVAGVRDGDEEGILLAVRRALDAAHSGDGRGHHHSAHPAERGRRIDDEPDRQRRPDARRGPGYAATTTRAPGACRRVRRGGATAGIAVSADDAQRPA